ncbi:MAG: hypothetical protein KAS93_06845 [Gammaproteobacteria bacterium]|nr:hypothetical protein [Gammaproteobacteria bacterium]
MPKVIANEMLCQLLTDLFDHSGMQRLNKESVQTILMVIVDQLDQKQDCELLKLVYYYLWLVELDFETFMQCYQEQNFAFKLSEKRDLVVSAWLLKLLNVDNARTWIMFDDYVWGADDVCFIPRIHFNEILGIIFRICFENPEYLLTKNGAMLSDLGCELFNYAKVYCTDRPDPRQKIVGLLLGNVPLMVIIRTELIYADEIMDVSLAISCLLHSGVFTKEYVSNKLDELQGDTNVDPYEKVCWNYIFNFDEYALDRELEQTNMEGAIVFSECCDLIVELMQVKGFGAFVCELRGTDFLSAHMLPLTNRVSEAVYQHLVFETHVSLLLGLFKKNTDAFVACVYEYPLCKDIIESKLLEYCREDEELLIAFVQFYAGLLNGGQFQSCYYGRRLKQYIPVPVALEAIHSKILFLYECLAGSEHTMVRATEVISTQFGVFSHYCVGLRAAVLLQKGVVEEIPSESSIELSSLSLFVACDLGDYDKALGLAKQFKGKVTIKDIVWLLFIDHNYLMPIYLLLCGHIKDTAGLKLLCSAKSWLSRFYNLLFELHVLCRRGFNKSDNYYMLVLCEWWADFFSPILDCCKSVVDSPESAQQNVAAIFGENISGVVSRVRDGCLCSELCDIGFFSQTEPSNVLSEFIANCRRLVEQCPAEFKSSLFELESTFIRADDVRAKVAEFRKEIGDSFCKITKPEQRANLGIGGDALSSQECSC